MEICSSHGQHIDYVLEAKVVDDTIDDQAIKDESNFASNLSNETVC